MRLIHHLSKVLNILLLSIILISCNSEQSSQPSSPINRSPVAHAGAAQIVEVGTPVTLNASASNDPDGDTLTYTWNMIRPTGSTSLLDNANLAQTNFMPDLPGTYTVTVLVTDKHGASTSATEIITVTAPPIQPAITLNQQEPLSGSVKLSLTGTVTGTVEWYADLRLLGVGNASDGHSISWNTVTAGNGQHQLLARIKPNIGSAIDINHTATVSNSSIGLNASVSGTTGTIHIDASATAETGIAKVVANFDGSEAGALTQPNACSSRFCSGSNNIYRFTIDANQAGSGNHTMLITAYDHQGDSRSITLNIPISNAPGLTLKSPLDGALTFGSLKLGVTPI